MSSVATWDLAAIRNPVIPGWYADPELRIHEGRFWLFPTSSCEFQDQGYFEAFVSDDLVHWAPVGKVLELKDVCWSDGRCAWAPSVVSRYGSMFMYFSAGDGQGLGLGVWHKFIKKFVDPLGRPIVSEWPFGAQPIDANVFIDDDKDQTAWLYFGGHRRCVAVKLKPDMNRLDGDFHLITPKGGEEVGGYVEGPFMFKRNGLYYFMWSEGDWTDHTYGVAYAISDSPTGPFDRIGRVLTGDAVHGRGAGHNSVLRLPGTDTHLIAYHRRPIGETASNHRVSCIDVMRFRRDGTIEEVEMT